jgi:hypothetical protein
VPLRVGSHKIVFVAAKLGIADTGPPTTRACGVRQTGGCQAPQLRRVLRALASVGVFAETADGRFGLTPVAATLRSDAPGSLRNFAWRSSISCKRSPTAWSA